MASIRARNPAGNRQGVALFMVIAAIAVLSVVVTEFAYIAQINKKVAYDGLDQLKAHYLAKSGLKLSLLRLKAYQTVKGVAGGGGGKTAAIPGLPKQVLEKIWSFPFFYPIPTNIPGMSPIDRERIEKFQKASNLEGKFSAIIASESSKYNLNLILPQFQPSASPSPAAPPAPPTPGGAQPQTPNPVPAPSAAPFNADEARKSLGDYLYTMVSKKAEEDPDFANEYRDWKIDDFMQNLVAWADFSYERPTQNLNELIPPKRAPFFTLSELHMIPGMDDTLYNLFSPALTVSTTPGININTMEESTLTALVPQMVPDERKDFFKFRDDEETDNSFKDADAFFQYLQQNVAAFRNAGTFSQFKDSLTKKNIKLVTEETEFRITVQATVNESTRLIEAWVTLGNPKPKTVSPTGAPTGGTPVIPSTPGAPADSGLKITFMRIL